MGRPFDEGDGFSAFRGFFWGAVFSAPIWAMIGVAIWWVRRG